MPNACSPEISKLIFQFYLLDTDDMGFGDQRMHCHSLSWISLLTFGLAGGSPDRIGGAWQLRRISSVRVNDGPVETLYQRDSNKGVILSTPLQLTLNKGSDNTITVGGLNNGIDGTCLDRMFCLGNIR